MPGGGTAGAGKAKKMSKTARFRDRVAHGCPLYQRAILYYPCPQPVMLAEEDGHDKCDHVECYRMALDRNTNFLDHDGHCIAALVDRRKMNLVLLIWQHLQAHARPDDDGYEESMVTFSVMLWDALRRNLYNFGPHNMRILRTVCTHDMLRPAVDAPIIDTNWPHNHVRLGNTPMIILQRAVNERNAAAIHLLADLLPPTAWPQNDE